MPLFFPGDTNITVGRPRYMPDVSPFVDESSRDLWANSNLADLLNNGSTVTVITVNGLSQEWSGEDTPSVYDSDNWLTLSGLTASDVKTLYESNADTEVLTSAKKDVLSTLSRHDTVGNIPERLMTDLPFMTTLTSIWLGDILRITSGGENVFFNSIGSGLHYFPSWGYLKDQSITANQDASGTGRVTGRVYEPTLNSVSSGTVNNTGVVPLENTTLSFPSDSTIFGYTTRLGESLNVGDILHYQGYYGSDASGSAFFNRSIVVDASFVEGNDVNFPIDPPVEIRSGSAVYIRITKESGVLVLGKPTIEYSSIPYFIRKYRSWEDKPLAYVDELPTGSEIKTLYEANTDTNVFTDAEKAKLGNTNEYAEVNIQSDWAQTDTGADDYIKNRPNCESCAAGHSLSTTNTYIQYANTYSKVDMVFTPLAELHWEFDDINNRWIYTGSGAFVSIFSTFTGGHLDNENDVVTWAIYKNGVIIPTPPASSAIEVSDPLSMSLMAPFLEVATNDYIEIYATINRNTETITTKNMNFLIR